MRKIFYLFLISGLTISSLSILYKQNKNTDNNCNIVYKYDKNIVKKHITKSRKNYSIVRFVKNKSIKTQTSVGKDSSNINIDTGSIIAISIISGLGLIGGMIIGGILSILSSKNKLINIVSATYLKEDCNIVSNNSMRAASSNIGKQEYTAIGETIRNNHAENMIIPLIENEDTVISIRNGVTPNSDAGEVTDSTSIEASNTNFRRVISAWKEDNESNVESHNDELNIENNPNEQPINNNTNKQVNPIMETTNTIINAEEHNEESEIIVNNLFYVVDVNGFTKNKYKLLGENGKLYYDNFAPINKDIYSTNNIIGQMRIRNSLAKRTLLVFRNVIIGGTVGVILFGIISTIFVFILKENVNSK